jgi:hypothetical protein
LRIIFFGREEEKGDGVRSGGGGGRTANEVVVVRAQELITGFVWRGAFGWVNHRRRKTRQQQQQLFIDVSGCTRGGWCRWKVCGGVWVAVGDSIGIGGARQHRTASAADIGSDARASQSPGGRSKAGVIVVIWQAGQQTRAAAAPRREGTSQKDACADGSRRRGGS